MRAVLFDFPKNAYFGKTIPKTKFYEHGNVSNKLKDMFVKQVEQITWLYKLAPETINVQATKDIPEIQIFEIALKDDDLCEDILLCIDKAVKFPVVFEIKSKAGVKTVCALKTRSIGDGWKISNYMQSTICSNDVERIPLNVSLNLNSIYAQIIHAVSETKIQVGESLEDYVGRSAAIKSKIILIDGLKKKVQAEKQFNKKVELNSKLRIMVDELNHLLG
jgi:hypothetical protein